MPWDRKAQQTNAACKVARALLAARRYDLAALQAAWRIGLLTQGIGLRPQPWARVSRPVGPVLLGTLIRQWEHRARGQAQLRQQDSSSGSPRPGALDMRDMRTPAPRG